MIKPLLAVFLAAATASAKVEWKETKMLLEVFPTQVSTEAVFHFTNDGSEPISFSSVQVGCGCLSAKPTKQSYAPGEQGTFSVMFNLLNRQGKQEKKVMVETSDGERFELVLSVNIPVAYNADPAMLVWKKGDAAPQKTIRLTNPNATPIKLLSIASSHEALPAELKTIREGFEYEVVVARKIEEQTLRSVLRIKTEPPPGQPESKTITIYVLAQ